MKTQDLLFTTHPSRFSLSRYSLFVLTLAVLALPCGCGGKKEPDPRPQRARSHGASAGPARPKSRVPRRTPSDEKKARIEWRAWDKGTFDLAQKGGKPILLSICVVWCPWCKKMTEGALSDPDIVEMVKDRYVPIRVDSDERPDINSRYNQGGWPTTVFLTPKGEVILGGTTFSDYQLKSMLKDVADLYQSRKEQIEKQADLLASRLDLIQETSLPPDTAGLTKTIPSHVLLAMKIYYDEKYGGFEDQKNKFPRTDVIQFLLYEYSLTGRRELLLMVNRTLGVMAAAGVYDHIGGGFHRYAVSADWRIPHFAKMCDENAGHIRDLLDAYQATGNGFYKRIAEETIDYVMSTLADRERGGFYGSQARDDAFYTWTKEQAERILTPEEAEIALRYFGIGESRNETKTGGGHYVLNVGRSLQSLARELHISANEAKDRLARALEKMRRSRESRKTPAVDKRLFTDWNAMMASSFLRASVVLGRDNLRLFALKTLDRLMGACYRNDIGMYHCLEDGKPRVQGLLADQVRTAEAHLDAYALTGDPAHLKRAVDLASILRKEFQDKDTGGFVDRIREPELVGRLRLDKKPIEENSAAARCLIRLSRLTGHKEHEIAARRALGAFVRSFGGLEISAAGYARAVEELIEPPLRLVVVAPTGSPAAHALLRECAKFYEPRKIVIPIDPSRDGQRMKALGLPDGLKPGVHPCHKDTRGEPIADPAKVAGALEQFVKANMKQEN